MINTDVKGRACDWYSCCSVCNGNVIPGDMIYYQAAKKNNDGSYRTSGITKHINCHNKTKRIVTRSSISKPAKESKVYISKYPPSLKKATLNDNLILPELKIGDLVRISPKHGKVDFHGKSVDNYETVYDYNTGKTKHLVDFIECLGLYAERLIGKGKKVRDIVIYGEYRLSISAGRIEKVNQEDLATVSWSDGPTCHPVSFTRLIEDRGWKQNYPSASYIVNKDSLRPELVKKLKGKSVPIFKKTARDIEIEKNNEVEEI